MQKCAHLPTQVKNFHSITIGSIIKAGLLILAGSFMNLYFSQVSYPQGYDYDIVFDRGIQSPTAASLGKYAEIPISLYSGQVAFEIPLHTIKYRDLEFPISISNNNSGLKVAEIPSWVGHGWALKAQGVVTRTVRGIPDEGPGGYTSTGYRLEESNIDKYFYQEIQDQTIDLEADIFFYNVAGASGKFMFDSTGTIRVLGDKPVKIVPIMPLSVINGWDVTLENGMIYTFSQKESMTTTTEVNSSTISGSHYSSSEVSYTSSWFLSKITSPFTGSEIIFNYTNDSIIMRQRIGSEEKLTGSISGYSRVTNFEDGTVPRLTSIVAGDETITFTAGSRTDFSDEKKLDNIQISKNGNLVRKFTFGYDYFSALSSNGQQRLRLLSVTPSGIQGNAMEGWDFEYYPGDMPSILSHAFDYWGYYNDVGANNSTTTLVAQYGAYSGDDRGPSSTAALRGMLKKITYPTGGTDLLEYEGNDHGSSNTAAGGLRIKKVTTHDGMSTANDIVKEFIYRKQAAGTQSSGILVSTPTPYYYFSEGQFGVHVQSSSSVVPLGSVAGSHIGYSEVTERIHHGATTSEKVHKFYAGTLGSSSPYPLVTDDPDRRYGRVIEQQVLNDSGNLLTKVANSYSDANQYTIKSRKIRLLGKDQSTGDLLLADAFYYDIARWSYLASSTTTTYDKNDPSKFFTATTNYHYETPSHRQLTKTVETNSDLKKRTTEYEYAHEQPGLTAMATENMLSQIYSIHVKNDAGVITAKKWFEWKNNASTNNRWMAYKKKTWDGTNTAVIANAADIAEITAVDTFNNPTSVKDANNNQTNYYYGSVAAPFSQNGFNGVNGVYLTGIERVKAGTNLRTKAEYDNRGRLIKVTDENDQSTSYGYDEFSRLITTTNANGFVVAANGYGYSATRNLGTYSASDPNAVESIAYIDPFYHTDFSSSTGWLSVNPTYNTFGIEKAGEKTVRMGGPNAYETMYMDPNSEDLIARVDFYPDNTTGGAPHIYLDSGGDRFAVQYIPSSDEFRMQYRVNSGAFVYPFAFPLDATIDRWYTIELQKSGSDLTAWVYPRGEGRDAANTYTLTGLFSASWKPHFRLSTNDNYFYAANLSIATSSQSSITYLDGLGRGIQSQQRGGDRVIATGTLYNDRGLPEIVSRPIDTTRTFAPGYIPNIMGSSHSGGSALVPSVPVAKAYEPFHTASGDNSELYAYSYTEYEDSPLARVEKATLPGEEHQTVSAKAVKTTYGLNDSTSEVFNINGTNWGVNTLSKTVTEDPETNKTITYTDGWGRTIVSGVDMDNDGILDGANKNTCTVSTCDLITEFEYDERGNLVRVEAPRETNTESHATTYTYNALGQLIAKSLPDQDASTEYKYDDKGRLRFTRDPNQKSQMQDLSQSLSGSTEVTKTIVANSAGTLSLEFCWADLFMDSYNILIKRLEDGYWVYSNEVFSEGDCIGSPTALTFNVGPGTYEFKGDASDPDEPILSTNGTFGFISNDIYTYTKYDELDRPTESGEYSGGTSFNNADPNTETFPTSGHQANLLYYYDGDHIPYSGSYIPDNEKGRLTKVSFRDLSVATTSWGHTYYSYNSQGLVEWIIQNLAQIGMSSAKLVEYHYDELGRLTRRDYQPVSPADRFITWYEYDVLGRLAAVYTDTDTDVAGRVKEAEYTAYHADGQVRQLKLGNSAVQTVDYTYTVQGWLERINDPTSTSTLGTDEFGMYLDYFDNGNVKQQDWRQPGLNSNLATYIYSYDDANRLKGADFVGGTAYDVTYSYDKNGNLRGATRRNQSGSYAAAPFIMSIDPGSNRLVEIEDANDVYVPGYDASGNMTSNPFNGLTSADYDWRNLPAQVLKGATTLQYAYDGEGNRVRKQLVGGTETHYIRGAEGETIAVYEDGVLLFHNILAGSEIIGNYDSGTRHYFLKDHLGSVRTTVHQNGGVVGYDDYYPFGLTMPNRNSKSAGNDHQYRFTGYEKDEEAGLNLYHANARTMDPVLGRFMQIDPKHDHPGLIGLSPYNYGLNNPMKYNDPDGECPPLVCGAIAGAVLDYAVQVGTNLAQGKDLGDALTDVDGRSIAVSAAAGATGVGLVSKIGKVFKNSDKVVKVVTRTNRAGEKGARITHKSGKIKDVTKDRVKQFKPEPKNPTGKPGQVNFNKNPKELPKGSKVIQGSKGKKRTPTKKEVKDLKKAKDIDKNEN